MVNGASGIIAKKNKTILETKLNSAFVPFKLREKLLRFGLLFVPLCLGVIYFLFTYTNFKKMEERNLQETAIRIENILNEIFEYHNEFITYLGKRIIDPRIAGNLNYIYEAMKNVSSAGEYDGIKILSWSGFDWISSDSRHRVNVRDGIIHASQYVSYREDLRKQAQETPWELHMTSPSIGYISGEWVIPAGFGIKTRDNKYLGLIGMGFHVQNLNRILRDALPKNYSSFVILEFDKHNIILQSSDNNLPNTSNYFKEMLKNTFYFSDRSGFFLNSIDGNHEIAYRYYKKMDNYPFIILTGVNKEMSSKEFIKLIAPSMSEFACILLLLIAMRYLHHKKYVRTAHASRKARQEIAQKSSQQLRWEVESIYQNSNILSQSFNNEGKILMPVDKQIELLIRIQKSLLGLQQRSITKLNMAYIDIEKLIKEAIIIHSHSAIIKNVYFTEEINPEMPLFYSDEFVLKQILIGVLSRSLQSVPRGSSIHVKAFVSELNLNIIIIDNGFELSDEAIDRISGNFPKEIENNLEGINSDIDTIIILVGILNGSYVLENNNGRVATLKFPFAQH